MGRMGGNGEVCGDIGSLGPGLGPGLGPPASKQAASPALSLPPPLPGPHRTNPPARTAHASCSHKPAASFCELGRANEALFISEEGFILLREQMKPFGSHSDEHNATRLLTVTAMGFPVALLASLYHC
jgi:hypothetical protein